MSPSQRRRRPLSKIVKVKPVSVSIAYDGRGINHGRAVVHTILVDSDGNVHERFADDPPRKWNTWPREALPDRPRKK